LSPVTNADELKKGANRYALGIGHCHRSFLFFDHIFLVTC
jgi:hypothetical protein